MRRFIIVVFPAAKKLQCRDADRRKQAVRPDDDQNDGDKIQPERRKRIVHDERDGVAARKGHDPEDRQKPARFGLPLARVLRVQKVNRLRASDAHEGNCAQKDQKQNPQKQPRRQHNRGNRDGKPERHVKIDQPKQRASVASLENRMPHKSPAARPMPQTISVSVATISRRCASFPMPRNAAKTDLPRSPLHQKAVCIKQEDRAEKRHDPYADLRHRHGVFRAAQILHPLIRADGADDVKRGNRPDDR